MRHRATAGLLTALLLIVSPALALARTIPPLFTTKQLAQEHCPDDVVVWLNVPSGLYRYRAPRWYGHSLSGAYVCKQDADQAGDLPRKEREQHH